MVARVVMMKIILRFKYALAFCYYMKISVIVMILCLFSATHFSCSKGSNNESQITENHEVPDVEINETKNTEQKDMMEMLTQAIYNGDLSTVKKIIGEDKTLLTRNNEYKLTPLASSCSSGYFEIVQYLLIQGADVNMGSVTEDSENPIKKALKNPEIVKILIEHGADVNKGEPLAFAASDGHYETVVLLVENGAEINTPDRGSPALRFAAAHFHVEIVRYLLSKGADVTYNEEPGLDGGTVLDLAANEESSIIGDASPEEREKLYDAQRKIVELLRQAGAKTAEELENQE
jgi:ankyrin repeat protein